MQFTMRLWPGDERAAERLAQLCADDSRTDVIRALIYLGVGEPLPPELQRIADRFDGLYVSAPQSSQPIINVTIDTTPIADALRGGSPGPFTDPPTRLNWSQ